VSSYLTVEEVAERLKVSVSWVYRHKDLLGAVRLGDRLWRFPEQEFTARLAGQAVPSPRAAAGNDGPRRQRARPRPAQGHWHLA
jgi:excisionase family DNA binding protein